MSSTVYFRESEKKLMNLRIIEIIQSNKQRGKDRKKQNFRDLWKIRNTKKYIMGILRREERHKKSEKLFGGRMVWHTQFDEKHLFINLRNSTNLK